MAPSACREGSLRMQGRLPDPCTGKAPSFLRGMVVRREGSPPSAGKAPSVCREGSLRVQGRLPPFREGEGWWCAEKAPSVCREGSLLVQGRPLPPVSAVNICQFILIDFHINADSCN